jgi:pimeloyl-ACP methyl ester carboxylesterase
MSEIILLHGALGSASQMNQMKQTIENSGHSCSVIEFSSHGNTTGSVDFGIEQFASELKMFLEGLSEKPLVFGYSMGGYVALYLALNCPELFVGIITLATKIYWNPAIALKEAAMLNPEKIKNKIPAFAEILRQRHKSIHWETLCELTANMMKDLGKNPPLTTETLGNINCPVLFAVGDRDEMIGLEETIMAYKSVPKAQLAVLPSTRHPIEKFTTENLIYLINQMESNKDCFKFQVSGFKKKN